MEKRTQADYRQKCGEITLINNRSIYFTCGFCKIEMQDIKKFLGHILKLHIVKKGFQIKETPSEDSYLKSDKSLDNAESEVLETSVVTKSEPVIDNYEEIELKQENKYEYLNHFEQFICKENEKINLNENTNSVSNYNSSEELEHLEEFFEEIPADTECHDENNEIGFEIEVLSNSPADAPTETPESDEDDILHKNSMPAEDTSNTQCSICRKVLRTEAVLKAHLQRHAEVKDKPFVCEYCDARFGHRSNLKVHVNRHLGIKPYSCMLCDKRFTSSTELKLHMHSHTGAKKLKCKVCDQRFARRDHLNAHNRRHYNDRRYECEICGNKFYDRRQLREHETTHTGERPFTCDTCGATFKRQKALREHNKLHLDVRNYECKVCQKSFAQYAGLYSHMKSHNTTPRSFEI